MNFNKLSLDYIQTLDVISASAWTSPLPEGLYAGIYVYIYGTHSGSVDPQTAMGKVKVRLKGFGEIVDVSLVNLQKLNNFFGGLPDSTAGTSFHGNAFIPFSFFGYPNSLLVNRGMVEVYVEKCQTTATTMLAQVFGVFGNNPENYIPLISQNRIPTLGGLQSEVVGIPNTIAAMLLAASTTNPDEITISSNHDSESFPFNAAAYFSDLMFNVEHASVGAILLPRLMSDIADIVSDKVRIKLTGGSGYMDYVTCAAAFDKYRRQASRNIVEAYRKRRYALIDNAVNRETDQGEGQGQSVSFSSEALLTGKL